MPILRRVSAHEETSDARTDDVSVSRLSIGSWAVYDVSNTLFFTGITGALFPLWVVNDWGGNDATVGFIVAIAMVINLVMAPVVGAMSDRARRRLPFLGVISMIGIAATLLLGAGSPEATVVLFVAALVTMHLGTVIYNALLVEVSHEGNRGFIGSIGAGIGYLGALLAVAVGLTFGDDQDYVTAFRVIAVLMLVMTLPVLILLRERPRELRKETGLRKETLTGPGAVGSDADKTRRGVFPGLIATIRQASIYPGLSSLLIGRFWYYLAVNTASIFAFLYGTETIGFSEEKVWTVLAIGIVAAIASAPLWGKLVDAIGPFTTMRIVLVAWLAVLLGTVAIPWLDLPSDFYWAIGTASGIIVAGTWVTDRPLLLKIIPAEHAGQFFGLQGLTGRLGTIVGPAMWGFIAEKELWFGPEWGLGLGQTASVVGLIVATVLAILFVTRSGEEFGSGGSAVAGSQTETGPEPATGSEPATGH
jgi:UMF1 family MFS transporter